MEKEETISWEEYSHIANEQYLACQNAQIEENKAVKAKEEEKKLLEEKLQKERKEKQCEEERIKKEEEEKERIRQEEILHQKKEEEDRKKREEEERKRKEAMKIKQEQEQKQREKARKQFKNIFPGMSRESEEDFNGVKIKVEKEDDTEPDHPFGTLPRKKDSADEQLVRIGQLIIDEDVYFALENLKTMGMSMWHLLAEKEGESELVHDKPSNSTSETSRSLFKPSAEENKNDSNAVVSETADLSAVKQEENLDSFASPKLKMFVEM